MQYSFKQLVFINDSLCELPLDIYQGDTIDVLVTLTDECNFQQHMGRGQYRIA